MKTKTYFWHIGGDETHPVELYVIAAKHYMRHSPQVKALGWKRIEALSMDDAKARLIPVARALGWEPHQ